MDNETKKRLELLKKELIKQKNSKVRVSGRKAQDRAKQMLGVPDSKLNKDSDEEHWNTKNFLAYFLSYF